MELRWLHSFVAVAEEQHFSRAARKLNLAQPALTTQIRQLEAELETPLFIRTNRMGGMTAAGKALLPEARTILERVDVLNHIARRAMRGESGVLRLGLIPPAATRRVADSLRRFAKEIPAVEIHVRQGDQASLIAALSAGELDLVLGRPPESKGTQKRFGHRRLFIEEQGILMRADDPLAAQTRVELKRLDGAKLMLLRGNPYFGQNLLELATRHKVRLTPVYAAQDFPSMHWMVRSGLGMAPCSLLLVGVLPEGLVAKPLRPAPPELPIHAIWCGPTPPPTAARWLQMTGGAFA